ncbi:HdeD family acid-resistance protein [Halococcus agarilyticus]|uniref:HdeD family acid-resistance protein n=1 Tax=Halococcus agarilyticus TaxID=1232219 RepID=UPI000677F53D|nr:HdeD family acid-resistance protein [Halococcus agarilyticus]
MSTETGNSRRSRPFTDNWRVLAGVGALVSILGIIAIFSPFVTGIALSPILGVLLVIGGIGHAVHVFSAEGTRTFVWQALLAVAYAVSGITLIANPIIGLLTLTLLLAVFFVIEGLIEVVMGVRRRPASGWGWLLASGVVGIVAGVLVWIGWPISALWVVGLVFGIKLLSTGATMIVLAMGSRRAARDTRSSGTTSRSA